MAEKTTDPREAARKAELDRQAEVVKAVDAVIRDKDGNPKPIVP